MTRVSRFRPVFVEGIPKSIEEGVLYISEAYETASHKCACGCGLRVVTPLTPTDWRVVRHGNDVSLFPSIGNWDFPCRSHYWLRRNAVVWADQWTDAEVAANRDWDSRRKAEFYAARQLGRVERAWRKLKTWFGM